MKRTSTARVGLGLAGLLAFSGAGVAQEADPAALAREIEELKKGQQQIRSDIADLRRLVETSQRGAQAPPRSPVEGKIFDLGDNPVKGESTASLVLVEFSDYQ